ncbi:hypothetical protein [Clostridium culturomicium]|uniref:hypothetical protein n=1 Tax=Clostridium culturomicium TaxID=1499683 RepID=UPI00058BDF76|nr:hypothetical protein [Clostridium culturomicium]
MAIEIKKEVTHYYYYNLDNSDNNRRYIDDIEKVKTILGEDNMKSWRPDYTGYGRIDYKAASKELVGNDELL